jgi:hypothetical protein
MFDIKLLKNVILFYFFKYEDETFSFKLREVPGLNLIWDIAFFRNKYALLLHWRPNKFVDKCRGSFAVETVNSRRWS